MRYSHLFTEIEKCQPKRIMEIGTWDGEHARQMVECAKAFRDDVEYYGFDLFQANSVWEAERQGGKRPPPPLKKAQAKLKGTGAKIQLVQGDTNVTLPAADLPMMDFVFIDGGHSTETILNDWNNVQTIMGSHTVVIFDDFYADDDSSGCKTVVKGIDRDAFNVEIMEGTDEFKKPWGTLRINFVKVTRK